MSGASAIYEGAIRHRRFDPVYHAFRYRIFMLYLDLDELPGVLDRVPFWSARRAAPGRFDRADYLGDPAVPLKQAVYDRVEAATGVRPTGPVRLLTHARTFGYVFNPVSFYYVYSPGGKRLETVVAEITNTPWKERHAYVLPIPSGRSGPEGHRFRFGKDFHVSPFFPMDLRYDWRLSSPEETLTVHMENHRGPERLFDATLRLERRPLTARTLNLALARFPLLTLRIVAAIHIHAARLWLRGVPFHPHPKKRKPRATGPASAETLE